MGMFLCDVSFSKGISDIIRRLQNTEYAEQACKALDDSWKLGDYGEVLRIFRNLHQQLQVSSTEIVQRISKDLLDIVEKQSARMATISRQRLLRREEEIFPEPSSSKRGRIDVSLQAMEIDNNQALVDSETSSACERGRDWIAGQKETFSSLSKRMTLEIFEKMRQRAITLHAVERSCLERLASVPLENIQAIVGLLSAVEKDSFFEVLLKSKSPYAVCVRKAILLNDLHDYPTVDLALARLYRSTIGKSLVPTHETQQIRDAQQISANITKIATLDYRLYTTMKRLKDLPKEFEALPLNIKGLLRKTDDVQVRGSEILTSQKLCKQVLHVIRAYNLVCLGDSAFHTHTNIPSLKSLFVACRNVIRRLKTEGNSISDLEVHNSNITHIPVEISYFKNLIKFDFKDCHSLSSVPSEIGGLKMLEWFSCVKCTSITSLPSELERLANIHILNILRCSNLRLSPEQVARFAKISMFLYSRSSFPLYLYQREII